MDWGFIFERTFSAMIGPEVMIYALAAVGLNVHFGYTGLMNFGQVGFMAAGAYGVGVTVFWLDWSFWIGIIFVFVYAAVLALLLGIPTLRLRADYLGLVTIAASETIRLFARSRVMKPVTGGVEGIDKFAEPFYNLSPFKLGEFYSFGPFKYLGRDIWVLCIGWTVLVLVTLMVQALMRSPWGRTLRAIREDEDAARALGKNAYYFKMQSLMLGGIIGALAGLIQVIQKSSVQADTFNPVITFTIWTILIIGGPGRVWSPIVGSSIYWTLIVFVENVLRQLPAGARANLEKTVELSDFNIGMLRYIIVGLGLLLLARYRPQGIFGSREEMALDRR
ncbi:MAG: branched-chain amino acid ABC transporter permease [Actinobacteria bacterium]|jgi:neutral amino acid transport system permease protein|nr:branched-chain amino acid ABC transporter permease [Actinomycetota bacterium]NDF68659.1 branched-chain amino acid ABC transporter permease [Actinomycetota bacterium]